MNFSIVCLLFASFGVCGEEVPSGMTLEQPKPVYQPAKGSDSGMRTEEYPCTPYPLCASTNGPSS